MKKMVKLLSIIMLFTMLFSMMSVSASAIINDGSAKAATILSLVEAEMPV